MAQELPVKLGFGRPWDMAVLVNDIDTTAKRLEGMGIGPFMNPGAPSGAEGLFFRGQPFDTNYRAVVGRLGDMQLEIIQPDDKPNPWIEFLNTKGEGIHHIGFQVEDVEKEVRQLTRRGVEVPFYGQINGKIGAAYVDLKVANILIELTSFSNIIK
jgi:methylmalonyl-CoA/ethylmalonyl-CoA epimerase